MEVYMNVDAFQVRSVPEVEFTLALAGAVGEWAAVLEV